MCRRCVAVVLLMCDCYAAVTVVASGCETRRRCSATSTTARPALRCRRFGRLTTTTTPSFFFFGRLALALFFVDLGHRFAGFLDRCRCYYSGGHVADLGFSSFLFYWEKFEIWLSCLLDWLLVRCLQLC